MRQSMLWTLPLLALGCASAKPTPAFVAAQREEEPPPAAAPLVPAIVDAPMPGQMRKRPAGPEKEPKAERPWVVIERANAQAKQRPDADGYFNAIMNYDYAPGKLFPVYTAPNRLTDLQLQPGERIVGKVAGGDTVRWVVSIGKSTDNGVDRQHVYVKPTRPAIQTTLAINTDRRTYHIELHAYRETYMAAVQWNYPADDLRLEARLDAERKEKDKIVTASVSVDNLNFGYKVEIERGEPRFVPAQVFDDGRKTFIRFQPSMLVREAPALFVLSRRGETQLVNYRVKNDTYIVDRLFDAAELRLGQQDQDVVRIHRTAAPERRDEVEAPRKPAGASTGVVLGVRP